MRNQADVNARRNAYREHERSNGVRITYPRTLDAPEVRPPQHLDWKVLFLPRKETRLMADEANRSNGLFLPYPLLGVLMTLILALGGGIIGLYTQISAMNTTLIMRDADYRREQQQTWEKIEQLQVYIQNDRERIGKLEERTEKRARN